jgi:hypothetical protein
LFLVDEAVDMKEDIMWEGMSSSPSDGGRFRQVVWEVADMAGEGCESSTMWPCTRRP